MNKKFPPIYIVVALIAGFALGWGVRNLGDRSPNNALPDNISVEEKQKIIDNLVGTYSPHGEDCPRFTFDRQRVQIYCYKLGPVIFDGVDQEYEYSHDQHIIRIPIHIREKDGIALNHIVTLQWNEVNEIGDEHGAILSKRNNTNTE